MNDSKTVRSIQLDLIVLNEGIWLVENYSNDSIRKKPTNKSRIY